MTRSIVLPCERDLLYRGDPKGVMPQKGRGQKKMNQVGGSWQGTLNEPRGWVQDMVYATKQGSREWLILRMSFEEKE